MTHADPDFDRFVDTHVDGLLRTAYLIVWDATEAEDVVQECLFKVARRWPKVRSMEQPLAYTRRILINLANDGARARARRRGELDHDTVEAPDTSTNPFGGLESRDELIEELGKLPERQRAVLVLRYFHDMTEAQAADVLGCSQGTVKSSASRGLARLREAFEISPQPGTTET